MTTVVPNISSTEVVLNISEHFNFSAFWQKKGLKIGLDFSFSDCVNFTFTMVVKLNLPFPLKYNDMFIMKNYDAAINLTDYCPAIRGVPIKAAIEAAGTIQTATSPILNVAIIFSSTMNVQGVSASAMLSVSKFVYYRAPASMQTAYDTEKETGLKAQIQEYLSFRQTSIGNKTLASLKT